MADLIAQHPPFALGLVSILTLGLLWPYLRRQPEALPLIGLAGVMLQRWAWWLRGTELFSLEVPLVIAALLSLSRILILFFVRDAQFSTDPFSQGRTPKKTVFLFLFLTSMGVAYQFYQHDIVDPAIDTLLASCLIINLSLFVLVQRQEAKLWAYAYNIIGIFLAACGILSPPQATFFYVLAFVPALVIRALK